MELNLYGHGILLVSGANWCYEGENTYVCIPDCVHIRMAFRETFLRTLIAFPSREFYVRITERNFQFV